MPGACTSRNFKYLARGPCYALQWRHNGHDGVWSHQPYYCLLNHLFRRRSKKTSKLRVAGLCEGNSPMTGEFPAQMASNADNVSIWWRHHVNEIWADNVITSKRSSREPCTYFMGYTVLNLNKFVFYIWMEYRTTAELHCVSNGVTVVLR